MQTHSLEHVSVWLDDDSSGEGALSQGLDWAGRLGLPLRVVVTSKQLGNRAQDDEMDGAPAPIIEKIKAWGIACYERGVIMETSFWVGKTEVGMDQFIRPWGLCVFEENRSSPVREELLARSARTPAVLLLLAPPVSRPLTRVLVLHQDASAFFLATVARLCQALEVQPLILTMAASEHDALLKQRCAERVFSSLQVPADFDAMVSVNVRAAVERVAAWRACSHVFCERSPTARPLWQRWRGDLFSKLRNLAGSLALLALPETVALDLPHKARAGPLGQSARSPRLIESSAV